MGNPIATTITIGRMGDSEDWHITFMGYIPIMLSDGSVSKIGMTDIHLNLSSILFDAEVQQLALLGKNVATRILNGELKAPQDDIEPDPVQEIAIPPME